MDWCGEQALNGVVVTRTPVCNIEHGEIAWDAQCTCMMAFGWLSIVVDWKGAKQCEDMQGFPSFWRVRCQKYIRKAIFIWRRDYRVAPECFFTLIAR